MTEHGHQDRGPYETGIPGEQRRLRNELTPESEKRLFSVGGDSYLVAGFFAFANDKEEALEWLEDAVSIGFINYPFLNEYDPFLASIRGEARFQSLMERVKKAWEEFIIGAEMNGADEILELEDIFHRAKPFALRTSSARSI